MRRRSRGHRRARSAVEPHLRGRILAVLDAADDLRLARVPVRLGVVGQPNALAHLGRVRARAALARRREDRTRGLAWGAASLRHVLRLPHRARLVDSQHVRRVRRREGHRRRVDDLSRLPDVSPRKDARVERMGAVRRDGRGDDPGARVLVDAARRAACVPVGCAVLLLRGEGARDSPPRLDCRCNRCVSDRAARARSARRHRRRVSRRGAGLLVRRGRRTRVTPQLDALGLDRLRRALARHGERLEHDRSTPLHSVSSR